VINTGAALGNPKLTTLYKFKGGVDGQFPVGGVVSDDLGRLYGVTERGGTVCAYCGTVYRLTPPAPGETRWRKTVLHSFGLEKGLEPRAGVIIDPAGILYGTTYSGGIGNGTVYRLTPPAAGETAWTEDTLHVFKGGRDQGVLLARLVRDMAGALYGTTRGAEVAQLFGTVFRVSNGGRLRTLRTFSDDKGGYFPEAALTLDDSGSLYGTTTRGGINGTVFKLTPPGPDSTRWKSATLFEFGGDGPSGYSPRSAVIRDDSGALFGTTYSGLTSCGTVFKLTPPPGGRRWKHEVLHQFALDGDGCHLSSPLIRDASGVLYGVTDTTIFRLSPPVPGQTTWAFNVLHHFNNGQTPGELMFEDSGALIGTTRTGGDSLCNCGTVFKLVP
jgi:uncharacterized repeat protein (TIGR03803 family)